MNCQDFRAQHLAFVDLALAGREHDAMTQHREACDACDRFDNAVRRGLLVARNLPDVRPSTAFGSRLEAKLRAARHAAAGAQRATLLPRPATTRTMLVAAAGLLGMIYLAEAGTPGSERAGMITASIADTPTAAPAPERPRPTPRIYSAPLRSPAVVTMVSTASNAEWMSPMPSAPAPSAFAPVAIEMVALIR